MINRYQKFFEIKDIEKSVKWDDMDELKVLDNDGVPCLVCMEDFPEQDEHESGVDWDSRNEDIEDR